jgi:hypothetical protein
MKWTVAYVDNSEKELADIWLRAEDQQAIANVANEIDQELRRNADKIGEDFYGDRIYQRGPLAVVYELRPSDRLVRVLMVLRIKG